MKPSWEPPPPPKCPRIIAQTLPRRSRRSRLNESEGKIQQGCVCPPMQLVHPGVVLCLLQEAPGKCSPARIPDGSCTAPTVPCVFSPLASLGPIELPQSDAFGSTEPIPPVGSGDDGGMPLSIAPGKATVVPLILLPPRCMEKVDAAVWGSTAAFSSTKPPRTISLPVYDPTAHSEEVERARPNLVCPELFQEGLVALLSAEFDLPRTSQRSHLESGAKPHRVNILALLSTLQQNIMNSGSGDESNYCGAFATFWNTPTLGLTTAMKDALEDFPKGIPPLPSPLFAAPYVPAVPYPTSWVSEGIACMVGVNSEHPRLVVEIRETAFSEVRDLDTGFSESGVTAEQPQTIKREVVKPRPVFLMRGVECGDDRGTYYQSFLSKGKRFSSRMDEFNLDDVDLPVWRDGLSNGDKGGAPRYLGPVWRDSDNIWLRTRNSGSPLPSVCAQKQREFFFPSKTSRTRPGTIPRPRSVSPLGVLLRRKRAQYSACLLRNLKVKHKPSVQEEEREKKNVSSRKGGAKEVVWKDTGMAGGISGQNPWGANPSTLSVIMGSTHVPSMGNQKAVDSGNARHHLHCRTLIDYVSMGTKPDPAPLCGRKTRPTKDRPATKPLRTREKSPVERGKISNFDTLVSIPAPVPGGPKSRRSQVTITHGRLLTGTSSSFTAVWKSIGSSPEDHPIPCRTPVCKHPRQRGKNRDTRDINSKRNSEGRTGVSTASPKKPCDERRAPAFEPCDSRDNNENIPRRNICNEANHERQPVTKRGRAKEDTWSLTRLKQGRSHEGRNFVRGRQTAPRRSLNEKAEPREDNRVVNTKKNITANTIRWEYL